MVEAAHTAISSSAPDAAGDLQQSIQTQPTMTHLRANSQGAAERRLDCVQITDEQFSVWCKGRIYRRLTVAAF